MFRNYLVAALRNFSRHKLYSFINIAGLTIGLTCTVFVILLVRDELSYDKWIAGTENLYRIDGTVHVPGQPSFTSELAAFPIPDAMRAQIPEVTAAVHLEFYPMTVTTGERQFLDHVNVVSGNFFQIVQLPMIAGSPATVFAQPESAVISESAARKYFGNAPAMGKTLKVGGQCQYGPGVEGCTIREATVLVTKAGDGELSCHGVAMEIAAYRLPGQVERSVLVEVREEDGPAIIEAVASLAVHRLDR